MTHQIALNFFLKLRIWNCSKRCSYKCKAYNFHNCRNVEMKMCQNPHSWTNNFLFRSIKVDGALNKKNLNEGSIFALNISSGYQDGEKKLEVGTRELPRAFRLTGSSHEEGSKGPHCRTAETDCLQPEEEKVRCCWSSLHVFCYYHIGVTWWIRGSIKSLRIVLYVNFFSDIGKFFFSSEIVLPKRVLCAWM